MASSNQVSLPDDLLADIRSAAAAEHRTVDDVLAEAVRRYLEDRSWASLLNYGAHRAEALGLKESDVDRLIAESRADRRTH